MLGKLPFVYIQILWIKYNFSFPWFRNSESPKFDIVALRGHCLIVGSFRLVLANNQWPNSNQRCITLNDLALPCPLKSHVSIFVSSVVAGWATRLSSNSTCCGVINIMHNCHKTHAIRNWSGACEINLVIRTEKTWKSVHDLSLRPLVSYSACSISSHTERDSVRNKESTAPSRFTYIQFAKKSVRDPTNYTATPVVIY